MAGPALAGLAAAPALAGRGRHPPVPADRPEYPADSDSSTDCGPRAHPDPAGRMTAADHSGTDQAGTGPAGPEVAGPAAAAPAGAAPAGAGRPVHPAARPAHAARPAYAGRRDPVARAGLGLAVRTGHRAPAAGPGAAGVRDRQAARSLAESQVRRASLARQGGSAGRTACRGAGSARCPAAARSLLACRSGRPRSGRCRSGSFRPTRPQPARPYPAVTRSALPRSARGRSTPSRSGPRRPAWLRLRRPVQAKAVLRSAQAAMREAAARRQPRREIARSAALSAGERQDAVLAAGRRRLAQTGQPSGVGAPALPVARLTGIGAESVLPVTRLGSLTTALVRQLELRRQYLPLVRPRLACRTGQRLATPDRSAEPGRARQHRLLVAAELRRLAAGRAGRSRPLLATDRAGVPARRWPAARPTGSSWPRPCSLPPCWRQQRPPRPAAPGRCCCRARPRSRAPRRRSGPRRDAGARRRCQ